MLGDERKCQILEGLDFLKPIWCLSFLPSSRLQTLPLRGGNHAKTSLDLASEKPYRITVLRSQRRNFLNHPSFLEARSPHKSVQGESLNEIC